MNAEEIIEKLLDERKISAKEAIILLKAIINVVTDDWIGRFKRIVEDSNKKSKESPNWIPPNPNPWKDNIVVMYGVQTYPSTWNEINNIYYLNPATSYEGSSTTDTYSDNNKLKG